jgi:hypothetical protein
MKNSEEVSWLERMIKRERWEEVRALGMIFFFLHHVGAMEDSRQRRDIHTLTQVFTGSLGLLSGEHTVEGVKDTGRPRRRLHDE